MILVLSSVGAASHAEDFKVMFDCGDIGVEARRILERLRREEARLDRREKELQRRENELKILQVEVDKKLEEWKALHSELDRMLTRKTQMEAEKVKRLSKIYQKRDPAEAAASLAAMDKNLAVSILSMMRDKYAGRILDNMQQETAVDYSTAMGRLGP
ncbi:MAG: hypothetical protein JRJ54_11095 [Deltaproteobacteria bacterium]|nr:hypothetical protein [Deltaproteobacteria bacterium]